MPLAAVLLGTACGGESDTAAVAEKAAASAESAVAEATTPAFPTAPLIDPNTASEEVLAGIEGLPEAAVAAVLTTRPFATPGEMHAAIGELLTDEQQKQVYARMFVKVGLHSGADEDYRLIPSSMPAGKLAHEFEEYRPYESIAQFRREMSKYVSEEEVAYLARFVTLD
ncbi:MAG: hypothetical protein HKN77_08310 [Woeseiaceae bacterium]|nr:hypothetical protein [Woeseiaceae bacterium]